MITMAYKFRKIASIYEFEEGSSTSRRQYTLENPAPEALRGMIVVDLWNMKDTIIASKKALLEHQEMYDMMAMEEIGTALVAGAPLDKDVSIYELLGRALAFSMLLENQVDPKDVKNHVDAESMIEVGMDLYEEMMLRCENAPPDRP